MNYYERHIGDFISDTVRLSMLEDGAYNRLLDQYYRNECPLPVDISAIYEIARARSANEKRAVERVLELFFSKLEIGFVQKRADIEIARFKEKRAKAKTSAETRWEREHANAMRTHKDKHANAMHTQSPDTSNQVKKNTSAKKSLNGHYPDVSPQIWNDFKALRARKKAPITETAMAGIKREAEKAGISLEAALAVACERGWQGFKAEWVTGDLIRDKPIDYDALIARAKEKENAH